MKIAAIGDIHTDESSQGKLQKIFSQLPEKADILVLCGDLTANGYLTEAQILVNELSFLKIPIIGVLGNHDFDHKQQNGITAFLEQNHIKILDGEYYILDDVGFIGAKGFCGGFDEYMTTAFGEEIYRQFATESINESLKLENALSRLPVKHKVVILHYSPIRETVVGEHSEIIPFLGSTHLAEPLDNFGVEVAFHGHAHHGKPEGKTLKGTPVFNVSFPLLEKLHPGHPFLLFQL